jgi:uncharacterized protein YkwD
MRKTAPPVAALAVRPLRWLAYVAAITATLAGSFGVLRPAAAAGDCTVSPTDMANDSEEQAMLAGINAYRAQNGLGALSFSSALNRSAAWMSKDMAVNRRFDHVDALGRDPFTRMRDCGYSSFTAAGENIAGGFADAATTIEKWKGSPSHNQAMLTGAFRAAGISRYTDLSAPYRYYWTLDLGNVVDGGGSLPVTSLPTMTLPTTTTTFPTTTFPTTTFPTTTLPATTVTNPLFPTTTTTSPFGTAATSNQAGQVSVIASLMGAGGQPVQMDRSGFTYTFSGATGASYTTPPTNSLGQTSLALPAGTYTVSQQGRAGVMFLGFTGGSGGSAGSANVTVGPGQTMLLTANNQVGAATTPTTTPLTSTTVPAVNPLAATAANPTSTLPGTLSIALSLVNSAGQPAQGDLSGYLFSVAAATGASYATPPTNATGQTSLSVPAGTYTVTQQPKAGFSQLSIAGAADAGGNVTVLPGQTALVTVVDQLGGAATTTTAAVSTTSTAAAATEMMTLTPGCNNVSMTWAAGTPISTIAASISGALDAIWRWDSTSNAYLGYSSRPGAPADYTAVGAKFEAAFICMKTPGSMTRPAA